MLKISVKSHQTSPKPSSSLQWWESPPTLTPFYAALSSSETPATLAKPSTVPNKTSAPVAKPSTVSLREMDCSPSPPIMRLPKLVSAMSSSQERT